MSRARLRTVFGTVLYVDEATGVLRHGAVDGSPANAVLALNAAAPGGERSGWLMHDMAVASLPISCTPERSWSGPRPGAAGGSPAPTAFELVPLDDGLFGLHAGGRYVCAEMDGRVTHSRNECGPWERFGLLGRPEDAVATVPLFPGAAASRYHLGCGPFLIPGFLNIDQVADVPAGRIFADFRGVAGAYFANFDLSQGIPGRDNSLELIYHWADSSLKGNTISPHWKGWCDGRRLHTTDGCGAGEDRAWTT